MSPTSKNLLHLEQAVIGAVFLDPSSIDTIPLDAADFHDPRAMHVWGAMVNLRDASKPIDPATVEMALAKRGVVDAVGLEFLADCALRVPTAANALEYARIIREAALTRRTMLAMGELLEAGRRGDASGAELVGMALAALSKLDTESPDDAITVGKLVRDRWKQLEQVAAERKDGIDRMTGLPTGVEGLDRLLGGWPRGIVSIVAARPGHGKSSLGLATTAASSSLGYGVHVFSLEDTRDAYADRTIAREANVSAERLRTTEFERADMPKLGPAIARLNQRRGWLIDDRSGISAEEIVRSVRRHRRDTGTQVVVVDYLQLLKWPKDARNQHDAIRMNLNVLADAAKADKLAYVVMSQLNRELERRADKRPMLSDLRESGSIEERSKCVVGLYRGACYGADPDPEVDRDQDGYVPSQEAFAKQVQLLVLKNSNGRTGRVFASWDGPTTTIA
jgi:replicative DNA helicase